MPGGFVKIVVGLGNPGSQYAQTRHNIGWMVLDRLADRAGWSGRGRQRDAANVVMGRFRGLDVTLVKPMTYMNDSGLAVRKVLARERAPLADLLIVADDFALPFGKLRFREQGSHGGHNGLRSVVEELGTEKFSRLRIGIGDPQRPGDRSRPVDVRAGRARADGRAARCGGRRGRGMGSRRHEQGGQPLQHVRAPSRPMRAASPRRARSRVRPARTASAGRGPAGDASACRGSGSGE